MSKTKLAVIVLAAGKGTRMKSDLPKVMHKLAGRPIIHHVLAVAAELDPAETVVVLAPGMDLVAEAVSPAKIAIQDQPLGTGHAVAAGEKALSGEAEDVLILNGDGPLITAATLRALVEERRRRGAAVAVL